MQQCTLSFFRDNSTLYPKERANTDLEVLRATTLTDDFVDLTGQMQSEASNVNTTSIQMRNILLNIKRVCTLPEYDDLLMKGKEYLHKKQEEVDSLIALYLIQHQADYATAQLMSSKIIMFSHLVQRQAIEILGLNQRVIEAYEQADFNFEETVGTPIVASPNGTKSGGHKVLARE